MLTAVDIEELLYDLFGALSYGEDVDAEWAKGATVRTYEEAMLLTGDRGLVLKLRSGNKLFLTVVVE